MENYVIATAELMKKRQMLTRSELVNGEQYDGSPVEKLRALNVRTAEQEKAIMLQREEKIRALEDGRGTIFNGVADGASASNTTQLVAAALK